MDTEMKSDQFNEEEHLNVRARLNNAKVLAPLVAAVLSTHSFEDEKGFAAALKKIGGALYEIVKSVLKSIAPSGASASMTASTASALSPILGEEWKRNPDQESYKYLAESFVNLLDFVKPDPGMVFNDTMPRITSDALAEARAVSKLLPTTMKLQKLPSSTRTLYLSSLSVEQFQDICRQDICSLAKEVAERLEPEDGKQQNIAYRSALNCISDVYAEGLANKYLSLNKDLVNLKNSSKEKREEFLEYTKSCSEGALLDTFREQIRQATVELLYPAEKTPEHSDVMHDFEETEAQHTPDF